MGSPRKVAEQATQGVTDSLNDIGTGVHQVLQGNVADGVSNYVAGTVGAVTGGLTQQILPGQTRTNRQNTEQANADVQASTDATNMKEQLRQTGIATQIEAMAKSKKRAPGRAQTLLTSPLTPSPTNNNTILTKAAGGQ